MDKQTVEDRVQRELVEHRPNATDLQKKEAMRSILYLTGYGVTGKPFGQQNLREETIMAMWKSQAGSMSLTTAVVAIINNDKSPIFSDAPDFELLRQIQDCSPTSSTDRVSQR